MRLVEHGRPGLLSDGVTLAVYRVVQESLTNALKHAPFSPVTVCLRYSDSSVDVEVTTGAVDRAPGGALVPAGSGAGWSGRARAGRAARRVGALDGQLQAGAAAGGGFRVHAHIPAPA